MKLAECGRSFHPLSRFGSCATGIFALGLGVCVAGSRPASAQANLVADRRSEIAFFGQAGYEQPGYGQSANFGYGLGGDFTPYRFRLIQPAIEIRVTGDNGSAANEHTYAGGVKLAFLVHGIHPYVTLLRGLGTISFIHPVVFPNGPYTHDSSLETSLGGGAEFDVGRMIQVRGDITKQYWTLDSPNIRPMSVAVGVAYIIPFRPGGMAH